MKILFRTLGISCLVAASLSISAASASDYIAVYKRGVRIRAAPNTTADIIGFANSGDIFEVYRTSPEWFGIVMFSGDIRYIYAPLAQRVDNLPALPAAAIRKEACIEIAGAQDRASAEAQRRFPIHFDRMIDHERLLIDRYQLPIFHRHGIAPAYNGTLLTECVTKKWR